MKIAINKINLVFETQITSDRCEDAKRLALANNFVFELIIPEPLDSKAAKVTIIESEILFSFLMLDDASKKEIIEFYKNIDNNIDVENFHVTYFSISSKGKVNIIIHAPAMNTGIRLLPATNLKVGVGFTFDSGLRFSVDDMVCIQ